MELPTIHLNRITEKDGTEREIYVIRGIGPTFLDGVIDSDPRTARNENELCWKVLALVSQYPDIKFVSMIPYRDDPELQHLPVGYPDGLRNDYFRLKPHQIPDPIKPYVVFPTIETGDGNI